MSIPLIAIVGRPNVGKSTFFNRMLNQRQSIVDSEEGITRDRIYGETEWCAHTLRFIDTGGYIPDDFDTFNAAVRKQAQKAVSEADLVLFMVNGKEPPTGSDKVLAQFIRECGKPYLLLVNKCDGLKNDSQINQYYEFGLDKPMPISALNGRYTGDILDAIIKKLKVNKNLSSNNHNDSLRLAIVGMPNVGKSSLTNALIKKERTIVTPIAGTTRDAIDVYVRWYGQDITLVDTAGLRKLAKIKNRVEYYSTVRTKNAIANSNVVLVLIDAEKGFGKQDKTIIDQVITKGKGLVLCVNKWDLIKKNTQTMKETNDQIRMQFKALDHYPIIYISALSTKGIHKVLEEAWKVYKRGKEFLSTKKLNTVIKKITEKNPPIAIQGRNIKIKFAAHVSCEPSVIAFYLNHPKLIGTTYKRYLENQLRLNFQLNGIPFKLSFRKK